MRTAATVLGLVGGVFAVLATNPGSVTITTDASQLSCIVTFGAGALAILGGAVTAVRTRVGAGLMGLALIAGGIGAPGTIPAIQDMLIIPYFAAVILLVLGVILAVIATMKPSARTTAASA